nr:C69 family dipeptidase [Streptococcus pyogenes]
MSSHYQDMGYDPYGSEGTPVSKKVFRPIGINRTSQTAILHIRPNKPQEIAAIQWMAYGSMPFNTMVPFFTQVKTIPDYFANTYENVSTDNFYWTFLMMMLLHFFKSMKQMKIQIMNI